MPGLVGGARLQRREDPHQSGVRTPLLQHRLDLVLFAEVLLPHVVDGQAVRCRQRLGVGLDRIGQRLGKLGEVENTNPPFAQVGGHAVGIAEHRQGPLHNHPVIARQHPSDLLGVPFSQQNESHSPPRRNGTRFTILFGSGYAGLGSGFARPTTLRIAARPPALYAMCLVRDVYGSAELL